jgi:DnaJ-domain-containing protein 1
MQQKVLNLILEELQARMNDIMRGMLDPSKFLAFIRSMGIDPSKLPGMISQQPGFDPYQILGLDKSASDEEVKKRYREHAYKFHPDTAGTPGTEFHFQMVVAAYEMIKLQRGWQ